LRLVELLAVEVRESGDDPDPGRVFGGQYKHEKPPDQFSFVSASGKKAHFPKLLRSEQFADGVVENATPLRYCLASC
jgi:hypothetical protein